jgi:hypothetical protein
MRQHFLLEGHGDGDAVEGQVADDGEQVVEILTLSGSMTALTFSRRKAVTCMSGESEWAMGLPATPKMRVAWSSCSRR